ncbi:MAG: ATP-binding protein [Pseudanabaenaceae cyanobacterium SKYGB_i_bin29]|nr:ATP-binding protein [Pseudanabaenaceae cyanobacterium SKYG29]MDW8421778.1 ATP-binding protein [Pseudanabaenaceae cyanobacterium SKYGB_i_bin29]
MLISKSLNNLARTTSNVKAWIIGGVVFVTAFTGIVAVMPGISPVRRAFREFFIKVIPRVQTVDFNMLFHMLPPALSQASEGNSFEKIFSNPQKYYKQAERLKSILDSNYGVFSLVITDISTDSVLDETKILYKTKKTRSKNVLDEGYVVHSDLILYPQPNCNTASYPSSRARDIEINLDCQRIIQSAVKAGESRVIGKVYYIRGKPPNFWSKFSQFLTNFASDSGGYAFIRGSIYFTAGMGALLYSLFYLFLRSLYTKELARELAEQKSITLEFERRAIEQELQRQYLEVEKAEIQKRAILEERKVLEANFKRQRLEVEKREIQKRILVEQLKRKQIEYEKKIAEERAKFLEAQNKLLRMKELDAAIRSIFDDEFVSPTGNKLQLIQEEYTNLCLRLKTDVQNIKHDLSKAPILLNTNYIPEQIDKLKASIHNNMIDPDIIIETLRDIEHSITVISQLTENLDKIISTEPQLCKLSELIQVVYDRAKARLPEANIKVFCQNSSSGCLGDCDCKISINPWHFMSILKNIIDNAYKACGAKSRRVRIINRNSGSSQTQNTYTPLITIGCRIDAAAQECSIAIEDNGPGIPEHMLDKLYQCHERLNNTNGTLNGNGSMICFAYLKFWDGKVKVENLAEGARVTVSFPICQ